MESGIKLPVGYRFNPRPDELIMYYLQPKVLYGSVPYYNKIEEVNVYKDDPENLTAKHNGHEEGKEWYFFTPRKRKYKNGSRPDRAAPGGYWKATGRDKIIKHEGVEVGARKALVFYRGKPPKGVKTPWIMHEFRLNCQDDATMLKELVLCKIYKQAEDKNRPNKTPERQIKRRKKQAQEEVVEEAIRDIESPVVDYNNNVDTGKALVADNKFIGHDYTVDSRIANLMAGQACTFDSELVADNILIGQDNTTDSASLDHILVDEIGNLVENHFVMDEYLDFDHSR